jgi:hypothetical protein
MELSAVRRSSSIAQQLEHLAQPDGLPSFTRIATSGIVPRSALAPFSLILLQQVFRKGRARPANQASPQRGGRIPRTGLWTVF